MICISLARTGVKYIFLAWNVTQFVDPYHAGNQKLADANFAPIHCKNSSKEKKNHMKRAGAWLKHEHRTQIVHNIIEEENRQSHTHIIIIIIDIVVELVDSRTIYHYI